MPERFEPVVRDRYESRRSCIKDHETGHVAVFVSDEDLVALATKWNTDPDLAAAYVWSYDYTAATEGTTP
jgi:hypothetical protein